MVPAARRRTFIYEHSVLNHTCGIDGRSMAHPGFMGASQVIYRDARRGLRPLRCENNLPVWCKGCRNLWVAKNNGGATGRNRALAVTVIWLWKERYYPV